MNPYEFLKFAFIAGPTISIVVMIFKKIIKKIKKMFS